MEKKTLNYVDTFNRIAIANYKKSESDSDMEDERIRKELLPKCEINYLDGIDVYLGGEKIAWSSYEKKSIFYGTDFGYKSSETVYALCVSMNNGCSVVKTSTQPFDKSELNFFTHQLILRIPYCRYTLP